MPGRHCGRRTAVTGLVTAAATGLVTAAVTGLVTDGAVGLVMVAATGAEVVFLAQGSDSMGMAIPGGGVGAIRIILILRTPIIPINTTGTMRITAILTMGIRTARTAIRLLPPPNGSRPPSPGVGIIAARLMAK